MANAEINDEPRDDGEEIFIVRQNGMFAILAQDKHFLLEYCSIVK